MTPPGFTGSTLDRLDEVRQHPERMAGLRADPGARLLALDGLDPRVDGDRLGTLPIDAGDPRELALLGKLGDVPVFVALEPVASAMRGSPALFGNLGLLAPGEAATYAAARSLVDWHARHGFCANCGTPTVPFRAGWARACPACRAEHFPRVDPVVIMLAEHGGGASARVLVGRQPAFPPGRYSALAGFLEPGEAIEEAVARELHEEAGVRAVGVRYLTSQPWPFPSQLMIGCVAQVDDDAIRLDETELADAMWVTREEVAAALRGDDGARFMPPPPYALAHTLLERWLAGA